MIVGRPGGRPFGTGFPTEAFELLPEWREGSDRVLGPLEVAFTGLTRVLGFLAAVVDPLGTTAFLIAAGRGAAAGARGSSSFRTTFTTSRMPLVTSTNAWSALLQSETARPSFGSCL